MISRLGETDMHKRQTLVALAVSGLFLLAGAGEGKTLKAEINHSDVADPVEAKLLPGQLFDAANLPPGSAGDSNNWYKIPKWLAGTWHKDSQTNAYQYNYLTRQEDSTQRTVIAKGNGIWGTQTDAQGEIWEFNPAPYVDTVDGGTDTIVQLIRSSEPLEVSSERFVKNTLDTQLRVDKATGKIKTVQTAEQISTYTIDSPGVLKRETSSKVFGQDGKPLMLARSIAYENKIADYQPRDVINGKNLKSLFQEYIEQNKPVD
jgi:hypothetical protein